MKDALRTLARRFKNYDLASLEKYKSCISSKNVNDENILSPYVPLVGKHYEEHRILVYATAQNIDQNDGQLKEYSTNSDRAIYRLYPPSFDGDWPQDRLSDRDVGIQPWDDGILPALVSMYLRATYKLPIDMHAIQDCVAVSNYYKFSFSNGKKDINPNSLAGKQAEEYWSINDELVLDEIKMLKPHHVIYFRGRQCKTMKLWEKKCKFQSHPINDPSWILRGHSGCLKSSGSYGMKVDNSKLSEETRDAAADFAKRVSDRPHSHYEGKYEAVRYYLLWYYMNWYKE